MALQPGLLQGPSEEEDNGIEQNLRNRQTQEKDHSSLFSDGASGWRHIIVSTVQPWRCSRNVVPIVKCLQGPLQAEVAFCKGPLITRS